MVNSGQDLNINWPTGWAKTVVGPNGMDGRYCVYIWNSGKNTGRRIENQSLGQRRMHLEGCNSSTGQYWCRMGTEETSTIRHIRHVVFQNRRYLWNRNEDDGGIGSVLVWNRNHVRRTCLIHDRWTPYRAVGRVKEQSCGQCWLNGDWTEWPTSNDWRTRGHGLVSGQDKRVVTVIIGWDNSHRNDVGIRTETVVAPYRIICPRSNGCWSATDRIVVC